MITAPELEIAVLVLGMVILMFETFTKNIDKRFLAFAGITGLATVLVASFFVTPGQPPGQANGFWSFYTADPLSIFFKQFALLTTILVLIMMIDYAPVVRRSFPGPTAQAGLGEFFAVPIFTCAGLMYMASAIDFIFIFVSLELVTISFYVLVSFTRRNPATLEAGVKYLILSALSTAFFVYGITWLFGATGETNLQRIAEVLSNSGVVAGIVDPGTSGVAMSASPASPMPATTDPGAALFGMVLVLVALGFKIACGAIPNLGARCLPGRADTGHRLSFSWLEGGGICRAAARLAVVSDAAANATTDGSHRVTHLDLRKPGRATANQSETAAGLLKHRACWISAHRRRVLRWAGSHVLSHSLSAHDVIELRGSCHRSAANRRRDCRL